MVIKEKIVTSAVRNKKSHDQSLAHAFIYIIFTHTGLVNILSKGKLISLLTPRTETRSHIYPVLHLSLHVLSLPSPVSVVPKEKLPVDLTLLMKQ